MAVPNIPQEFWEDVDWTRSHHTEFLKEYRGKWIVVVDKEIVAAGENLELVEVEAKKKTGRKYVFSMFVDGGEHIYGSG